MSTVCSGGGAGCRQVSLIQCQRCAYTCIVRAPRAQGTEGTMDDEDDHRPNTALAQHRSHN